MRLRYRRRSSGWGGAAVLRCCVAPAGPTIHRRRSGRSRAAERVVGHRRRRQMVTLGDLRRMAGARCKLVAGSRWYAACSNGSVWTRRRSSRNKTSQWMRLSESVGSHGYRCVKVGDRTMCVHIVVLTAFRGPPKRKQEARHYDGDKLNNSLSNLLWGTSSENKMDNVRLGRHGFKRHLGDTHPAAKLRSVDVVSMRALHRQGRSIYSIAKQFGVTDTAAGFAIKGITWSHV